MNILSHLGIVVGFGIFGAVLTALAVWLLGGPIWAVVLGYVLGGMAYTLLAGLWLARPISKF